MPPDILTPAASFIVLHLLRRVLHHRIARSAIAFRSDGGDAEVVFCSAC